jgi:gamma-glutamyltranspeptidase/glutathione hydrolase
LLAKVFISRNASVATEHPLASLAAFKALESGGNAVDATVAASFTLAVVQHHLGGIGGDFFALLHEGENGSVHCLNASGWAPSGLTLDTINSRGYREMPTSGACSATIPGMVRGVYELHKKFGRKEFSDLLSYPIKLAKEGFPVSHGLSTAIKKHGGSLPPPARKLMEPNGHALQPGELLAQQALASVLKAIAEDGPGVFYDGWVADRIRDQFTQDGVPTEIDDLRKFEPEWCNPLKGDYRGTTVYEMPPNSMGATTLLILAQLATVEMSSFSPRSPQRIESVVDAVKMAYDRRDRELGDPRFDKIDLQAFLSPNRVGISRDIGVSSAKGDTTNFAIVDSELNFVSGIQSLFRQFGSRVFVEEGGFFLNNRASSFRTAGPNKLEPRKRPLHTLSTLMLAPDDEVRIALGCSAGENRPQLHALFITNLVDYSMTLEEAIDFPRFMLSSGDILVLENVFENPDALYHQVESLDYPGATGVAHGVEVLGEGKKGVCDVRGDGIPLGF